VTEDHATDRAREKADRERRVGAQCPGQRIESREEQLVEDQRRGRPVEEEVVPLDGGADEAGEDDAAEVSSRIAQKWAPGVARCQS
jgi:hypothetical protein